MALKLIQASRKNPDEFVNNLCIQALRRKIQGLFGYPVVFQRH